MGPKIKTLRSENLAMKSMPAQIFQFEYGFNIEISTTSAHFDDVEHKGCT